MINKYPSIRFPNEKNIWDEFLISDLLTRIKKPVKVLENEIYNQIGIRSHGKGIFYKPSVSGTELGNKSVFWIEPDCLIVNIVFAWEKAIAKTTEKEIGMIASHRFPMYKPIENIITLDFILSFFKTNLGKYKLGLASPGGAGRNKTLGQKDFAELKLYIPGIKEQLKITSFLSVIESKIDLLTQKKDLMEKYKRAILSQILSRKIRFKNNEGKEYPEWELKKLSEIAISLDNKRKPLNSSQRNLIKGTIPYYGANGIVDHISEFLFDEELILLAEDGGNFDDFRNKPIAQHITGKTWVNNHAHVIKSKNNVSSKFLYYSLVHKDIRKYINGTSRSKLNKNNMMTIKISIPSSIDEQNKIALFISSIDSKIGLISKELTSSIKFKEGLMQHMFI